jgi:anti-sigma B factor antagonist
VSDARFHTKVVNGIPVVETPEEIDITNAAELQAALHEAADQGHATFIVDMSRTLFCDTSGLHVLVLTHKQALALGGEVRLVGLNSGILRIFTVTGIDQVIPRFAGLDEALARQHGVSSDRPASASGSGC